VSHNGVPNSMFSSMKKRLLITISIAGVLLASITYLRLAHKSFYSPTTLTISGCRDDLRPRTRRIGNRYGIQFDVPTDQVNMSEGTQDAAPFSHGFRLDIHGKAALSVSFGPEERPGYESPALDRAAVFSSHLEKRNILDSSGALIGEDSWGYMSARERWRRIRLRGPVYASYDHADESNSAVFDRIISSACFLSSPGS
jgi:hypothetical protein